MDYTLKENALTTKDYIALRESAGWRVTTKEQVEKGLKNTPFSVTAEIDGQTVAMGRLIGDGYIFWYVQDVVVLPQFQGQGIGKAIMNRLITYVKENSLPGTTIKLGLMSAIDKEEFYKNLGFRVRPNSKEGAGMIMDIEILNTKEE